MKPVWSIRASSRIGYKVKENLFSKKQNTKQNKKTLKFTKKQKLTQFNEHVSNLGVYRQIPGLLPYSGKQLLTGITMVLRKEPGIPYRTGRFTCKILNPVKM